MINFELAKLFELKCKLHGKVKWFTLGPWHDSKSLIRKFRFETHEGTVC